jgi:hypothetical protein
VAFAVGAFVGLSELLSRYTSAGAFEIARLRGGKSYLVLNGLVAVLAYYAAVDWQINLGLEGKSEIWRVLLISVASMAILRTSFLNLRFGDKEVPTGMATFVQIFLTRSERSLDQELEGARYTRIGNVLKGLTYESVRKHILVESRLLLKSLTPKDLNDLDEAAKKIDEVDLEDDTKMKLLSRRIIDIIGENLFVKIAQTIKNESLEDNELPRLEQSRAKQIIAEARARLSRKF